MASNEQEQACADVCSNFHVAPWQIEMVVASQALQGEWLEDEDRASVARPFDQDAPISVDPEWDRDRDELDGFDDLEDEG